MRALVAGLLAIVLLPALASADYLEVRRAATIKARPDGDATIIRPAIAGEFLTLALEDKTGGYYAVHLPGRMEPGWIYQTLVRRYPGDPPTAGPSGAAGLTAPAGHLRLGKPILIYERVREGYAIGQDGRLKVPLWVQYELRREDLNGPAERRDNFGPDASIPAGYRAELADYSGSGFQRGHMAPAQDMTRSESVMTESFFLSNMCPQNGPLNGGMWARLEANVRGWVEQRGTLTVITGPVFMPANGAVSYQVIGGRSVAVPTHLYKIVVEAPPGGVVRALAFLVPNARPSITDLAHYLVSIDAIETATGLDVLSELPDNVEDAVEGPVAGGLW